MFVEEVLTTPGRGTVVSGRVEHWLLVWFCMPNPRFSEPRKKPMAHSVSNHRMILVRVRKMDGECAGGW